MGFGVLRLGVGGLGVAVGDLGRCGVAGGPGGGLGAGAEGIRSRDRLQTPGPSLNATLAPLSKAPAPAAPPQRPPPTSIARLSSRGRPGLFSASAAAPSTASAWRTSRPEYQDRKKCPYSVCQLPPWGGAVGGARGFEASAVLRGWAEVGVGVFEGQGFEGLDNS